MAKVELYFGGRRGDGSRWRRFVADVITPRFPLGLTAYDALGQWRGGASRLVRERSHVVVIFYAPDATTDRRIEAIRTAYERDFRQSSVLRADSVACVSF